MATAGRTSRKGIAAFELAVVLLFVLLPLIFGMFEVGRLIHVRQVMMAGAREGGRQIAAGMPTSDIPGVVTEYLSHAGLPTGGVQVQVGQVSIGFSNPLTVPNSVTASIPVQDVSWVSTYWFTDDQQRVTVQTIWPRSD